MRFAVAAAVLASVGFAAAQSSTSTSSAASSSSTSSCQAANIVDACVSGLKSRTEGCGGNDWDCLCSAYTDLLTCYNNCPNDPTRSSVNNQVTQFCNAANANKSTSKTSSGSATVTATSSSAATASASATATSSNFDSFSGETSSSSSARASSTGAAAPIHVPAGGALGLAIGIAALL